MSEHATARLSGLPISGDRPIEVPTEDRLGFEPLAKRLARGLIDQASADGLVFGLEGRWGSGKSSLLNLTVRELGALPEEIRPVVVEFKPWLIGNRDALLEGLFAQLASKIEAIQLEAGSSPLATERQRRELVERFRNYATKVETVGSILTNVPTVSWFGKLLGDAAHAAAKKPPPRTLIELKHELDSSLKSLTRRIVVTIDDVDRLEPNEVIELLRLVRSVGDFKNVIYVLCYDSDILSRSIRSAIRVKDGRAYLEKIIQVSASVPLPEPFQLRRWFELELNKLIPSLPEEKRSRLSSAIDIEGGRRLSTPRQIVRALNALHLMVPAIGDEVDLPDLVWLQLVKVGNEGLYRWIEDYSASAAVASSSRATIRDEAKRRSFEELEGLLRLDGTTFEERRFDLAEYLPGITTYSFAQDKNISIHNKTDQREIERSVRDRRLASPDHYRLYFALVQPTNAPRVEDFDELIRRSGASTVEVEALFRVWFSQTDPIVGSKADIMLDRLRERGTEGLPSSHCVRIFLALANVMDEPAGLKGLDDFGMPSVWREGERAAPILLQGMTSEDRRKAVIESFASGRALGWLTSIFRHEIFSHGRFGDQRQDQSRWLLSEEELDAVTVSMVARYRSMSMEDFSKLPNTLSALFAWNQAANPEEPKHFIENAIETDKGLVKTLSMLSSLVRSSSIVYRTLQRTNVTPFLDFDTARLRIENITVGSDAALAAEAKNVLKYFELGDTF